MWLRYKADMTDFRVLNLILSIKFWIVDYLDKTCSRDSGVEFHFVWDRIRLEDFKKSGYLAPYYYLSLCSFQYLCTFAKHVVFVQGNRDRVYLYTMKVYNFYSKK